MTQPSWNLSYVFKNVQCSQGFGCYFKNLNEVGQYYPMLVILILEFVTVYLILIKRGNDPLKSFTALCFANMLISTLAWVAGFLNDKISIGILILLSVSAAVSMYRGKNG